MITVRIQNERGEARSASLNIAASAFPDEDDARFNHLRFIDPYGDTTFNRLQCEALVEELRLLEETAAGSEWSSAIREIAEMAKKCASEPHFYLKFIGD